MPDINRLALVNENYEAALTDLHRASENLLDAIDEAKSDPFYAQNEQVHKAKIDDRCQSLRWVCSDAGAVLEESRELLEVRE